MLLNGLWKFSFNDEAETELPVPGCFDACPQYRFLRGIGTYRRQVLCGGNVELRFDGLGLRAHIFWDGREIAFEPTAYTPLTLRFNAGNPGEHELKVVCDNTIDESPESEFRLFYDFYGFGGIYRDVELRELPESYVDFAKITTSDLHNGCIRLQVKTAGKTTPLTAAFDGGEFFALPDCSGGIELEVPNPQAWSPQHPHLHTLQIRCGTDLCKICFGLRTIEARDGQLFLNGKALILKGVNRHDAWPDTGAAVPPEVIRNDLLAIKNAGMNCIRGSHYPQSEALLNLADELGLLVWNETLGWENPIESLENQVFRQRQKDGLRRMIQSSFNHPSIIFWGFLNEAITNDLRARPAIAELAATIRAEDSSRPITFATMFGENDLCLDLVDVISFNTYPCWYGGNNRFFDPVPVQETLDNLLSFVRSNEKLAQKPVLISEIGAGALPGDHSGRRWSEEYQAELIHCAMDTALRDPRCSGILLWQFCNSPVDDNPRIMMRPRGYNNKGLVDEFRKPKLVWKQLTQNNPGVH